MRYTCPRFSVQSCSLHNRRKTGCTGERDKVKYVPMKEYGYGALMNDSVNPEDVGREVKEWANDICEGFPELPSDGARGGRWKKEEA